MYIYCIWDFEDKLNVNLFLYDYIYILLKCVYFWEYNLMKVDNILGELVSIKILFDFLIVKELD